MYFLPVFGRCYAGLLFELAEKVDLAGISGGFRNLFHGKRSCFQKIFGIINSHLNEILLKRDAKEIGI